ncbi:MAG: hypothetical protein MJ187_03025 [Alphaproteobacteria bacterium]|nr:hypothetical protein [Alphaproteobacteria bacterium]
MMNKFLAFVLLFCLAIPDTTATVRGANTSKRQNITNTQPDKTGMPVANLNSARSTINSKNKVSSNQTSKRTTTQRQTGQNTSRATSNANQSRVSARVANSVQPTTPKVTPRAAAIDQTSAAMAETRTGAEYEKCKSAFFTCMDQFCQLKSDDYRRCACSNRMKSLSEVRTTLQEAGNQLTVFTENLDVVGMTKNQATAMKTASDGENALTSDKSASKALLQAIMNSLRGEDSNVGGKYSDLNSINISFDAVNSFGTMDAGQAIAKYSGQNLYSAVYPQCRQAVKADCNNASMQRAINAYLMAIEQDCNTVQSAIENMQKQAKASIRESSAMLDLARIENRQNHNSDDIATCINNVESAILSEEVCGKNYHKCLDNGEFIDISTGAPIAGIKDFYKLEQMLTFADDVDLASQKLSKLSSNRTFVLNFESHVKKFAKDALDRCREKSDDVWSDYLDKALLDIYYSQKDKVNEIKQGCFDFISACQENGNNAMTAAMASLTGDAKIVLQPDTILLTKNMCDDYIRSCDNMFDGDTNTKRLFSEYINHQVSVDTLAACRAIIQQCFDNFGGKNYENFYVLSGGIITPQRALDWFTLYDYSQQEDLSTKPNTPLSKCAQQAINFESCRGKGVLETAFGGFDKFTGEKAKGVTTPKSDGKDLYWGQLLEAEGQSTISRQKPRPIGVASEIYYKIIDILSTQCRNLDGSFVEIVWISDTYQTPYPNAKDITKIGKAGSCFIANQLGSWSYASGAEADMRNVYSLTDGENMCPKGYSTTIDTDSWGACLCWENGARRSNNGQSTKCEAMIPNKDHVMNSAKDQVCPAGATINKEKDCTIGIQVYSSVPSGMGIITK